MISKGTIRFYRPNYSWLDDHVKLKVELLMLAIKKLHEVKFMYSHLLNNPHYKAVLPRSLKGFLKACFAPWKSCEFYWHIFSSIRFYSDANFSFCFVFFVLYSFQQESMLTQAILFVREATWSGCHFSFSFFLRARASTADIPQMFGWFFYKKC